jgi:protocatechuate 3,4-dioxygenase beta subunit
MILKTQMLNRRRLLTSMTLGAAAWTVRGAFAEQLVRTPQQTEGPFYPNHLPLDTDNDLLMINDGITPAVGEVTHLTGRILDGRGDPIKNALVEIWQVDNQGIYLHTGCPGRENLDRNFQGFGKFLTGSKGEYYFRTIKPVPYGVGRGGRTPHIHFAVKLKGQDDFTTQCYVKGEPQNEKDGIYNSVKDPLARESITIPFTPIEGSEAGELAANFDIVLGYTPAG